MKIEPGYTNVAENVKDPPSEDRAHHPQKYIQHNSFAMTTD